VILPIGDTPNPRGFTPWVNWMLIAANVLVYLLATLPMSFTPVDPSDPGVRELFDRVMRSVPPGTPPGDVLAHLSAWDLFVEQHGYVPGDPSIADLLSAMFLHANLAHLAGNLLFLWIYGDNVEHRLGRLGYLGAYLATGVVATLAFAVFAPLPDTPLVGASGAISGVLGLYFLLFPRNLVKVFVGLFPFVVNVWLVPAPIVLGVFVVVDNLLPFLVGTSGSVAYGAHLGGFVAGAVMAIVLRAQGRPDSAGGERAPDDDDARWHLLTGEALLARGQPAAAFQHLAKALDLDPDPPTRDRIRAALAELPLDPGVARRLGL
jgi:membrane associated rhomboid family serine protease